MINFLITAALVASCPEVIKTNIEGVYWNKMNDAAIKYSEDRCKKMGFECLLEIKKYDEYNFAAKCGFKEKT